MLIVVPTYNERDNLDQLFEGIRAHVPGASILIVDDGSPDGTGEYATALGNLRPDLRPDLRFERGRGSLPTVG